MIHTLIHIPIHRRIHSTIHTLTHATHHRIHAATTSHAAPIPPLLHPLLLLPTPRLLHSHPLRPTHLLHHLRTRPSLHHALRQHHRHLHHPSLHRQPLRHPSPVPQRLLRQLQERPSRSRAHRHAARRQRTHATVRERVRIVHRRGNEHHRLPIHRLLSASCAQTVRLLHLSSLSVARTHRHLSLPPLSQCVVSEKALDVARIHQLRLS